MSLLVACGTEDGENFVGCHFGDSAVFHLYRVDKSKIEKVEEIKNTTDIESDLHDDDEKAQGITQILKKKGVNVLISRRYGPNILKVKKHFVAVKVNFLPVTEGLKLVQENYERIVDEYNKGSERTYLVFNVKK